ncbi:MAG: YdcF family protein [Candidatus Acidiferrales bacterium]
MLRLGNTSPATGRNAQRGGIIFKFLLLVCFLCFVFVIYLVRHPLLRLAGGFWIVDDGPAYSDAIVVLSDDDYGGDRAARAAELFKAGWAPRVVASGRFLRPYATVAELEEHDLKDDGVPQDAIIRFEHHATDTKEEAEALRQLILQRGWKRILVVTSNYHARRARYICARTFPAGTMLRVVPAADSEYDPNHWWATRRGLVIFSHEFVGMIVSLWEMRHQDVQTTDSALLVVHSVRGICAIQAVYSRQ